MKFSIPVQELQGVVNLLGITAKVNTAEVPGRILIEVSKDSVLFLSNNLSTGVSILTHNVVVEEIGRTSVIFSSLKSFVSPFIAWDEEKQVGAKDFVFKGDEHNIIISVKNKYSNGKVSNGRMRLSVYNADSIPKQTAIKNTTFTLNSDALKAAVSKVLYCVDPNCMAASLRGMCLRFDENDICFVGSDGKALSEFTIGNESEITNEAFVVKLDYVMALRRFISPDIIMNFEVSDKSIKMQSGDVLLWGKTIVGSKFPDYKGLLTDYQHEIAVDKEVLMSNLVPFIDSLDANDYNRLSIKIENKKLTFYNESGQFICDCDFNFSGEHIVDMNGLLLYKTIDAIKDTIIAIRFSEEPTKNVLFDSMSYNNQKALIVPLRRR